MGLILIVMTLLKTTGYFASAAVMVPLRTGIVRDIRIEVYNKVLRLPLSFFSEERKGDIIARMSADVSVVENSLTSSLDMLIRNPIALVVCFITLFTVSWQLTLFVLVILPLAGWVMGSVSRKLKSQSVVAQGQWGDIMSQLDETLGGLRIIKAFIAERKMSERFAKINNGFRDGYPSEFCSSDERVFGYLRDCDRIMVWRRIDFESVFPDRCRDVYFLSGDSLQHHQSSERVFQGFL